MVPSTFINNLRQFERNDVWTSEHLVIKAHVEKAKKESSYSWKNVWSPVFNSVVEKKYFDGFGEGGADLGKRGGVRAGRFAFFNRFFENAIDVASQNDNVYLSTINDALRPYKLSFADPGGAYCFTAFALVCSSARKAEDDVYISFAKSYNSTTENIRLPRGTRSNNSNNSNSQQPKENPREVPSLNEYNFVTVKWTRRQSKDIKAPPSQTIQANNVPLSFNIPQPIVHQATPEPSTVSTTNTLQSQSQNMSDVETPTFQDTGMFLPEEEYGRFLEANDDMMMHIYHEEGFEDESTQMNYRNACPFEPSEDDGSYFFTAIKLAEHSEGNNNYSSPHLEIAFPSKNG